MQPKYVSGDLDPQPVPHRDWSYVLHKYKLEHLDHLPLFLSKLSPSDYEVLGRLYDAHSRGIYSVSASRAKTTYLVFDRLSRSDCQFLKMYGANLNRAVITYRGRRAYEIFYWVEHLKHPDNSDEFLAYQDWRSTRKAEQAAKKLAKSGSAKRGRPVGQGLTIRTGDPTDDRYWNQVPAGLRLKLYSAGEDALEMYKFYRDFGREHMIKVYGPLGSNEPITDEDMVNAALARKKALQEKNNGKDT